MTLVKICGMQDLSTATISLMAGADMLGFVFAPSRRQVAPATAARILIACRERYPGDSWTTVGVFANQPLEFVREVLALCKLDVVQLSGEESPEYVRQLPGPVFKAVHLPSRDLGVAESGRERLSRVLAELALLSRDLRPLLDTSAAKAWGGTGQTFDWLIAKDAARQSVVAGGLTPFNVGDAIGTLHPWAVDVSSGVEVDGQKDPWLIRRFISEVRRCDKNAA